MAARGVAGHRRQCAARLARLMRALVLHPSLKSPGGSSCLTAWALQALRDDFDVTLLSWTGADVDDLNAAYGTNLRAGDFAIALPARGQRAAFAALPLRLGLLRSGLLQRYARKLDAARRFDLIISTDDVIDVRRHAIQYVHYPWTFYPRPGDIYEWYHVAPVMRLYRAAIDRFCELSTQRMAANTTLTNSAWTARRIKQWYGTDARVIHPPVAVAREILPWEGRNDTFATIGRIAPVKQLIETIDIIEQVRGRGHEVSLLICGQHDDKRYEERLRAAASTRPWVELLLDAPRDAMLDRVAACRYGIHAMPQEHFGIALAEMVRLGLVSFAHCDGGTAEILDGDQRLLFDSPEQAVAKICNVLGSPQDVATIRSRLANQASKFSAESFMAEFVEACKIATGAAGASLPHRGAAARLAPAA
jgi:glycosyltransferase involved in cell wall biosynthesis